MATGLKRRRGYCFARWQNQSDRSSVKRIRRVSPQARAACISFAGVSADGRWIAYTVEAAEADI